MDTYIVRRHLKIYATEGVYAVSEKRASFLLRPVPPPFLRPRPPVSSGSKTVSSRLPTAFNFPGGRLMTRPVTNKPRLLAPRRCLRLALDNFGPLFFVVRIIAYRTKLGLDSDRLVLHRERLGIRLRTIMFPRPGSFLRIEFQPDHEPAILLPRFANNTANRRRRKERERERERKRVVSFSIYTRKGIIIVYLIETDLSLAFYDPITRMREAGRKRVKRVSLRGIEESVETAQCFQCRAHGMRT